MISTNRQWPDDKSLDWFLYDNGLRHGRVNAKMSAIISVNAIGFQAAIFIVFGSESLQLSFAFCISTVVNSKCRIAPRFLDLPIIGKIIRKIFFNHWKLTKIRREISKRNRRYFYIFLISSKWYHYLWGGLSSRKKDTFGTSLFNVTLYKLGIWAT